MKALAFAFFLILYNFYNSKEISKPASSLLQEFIGKKEKGKFNLVNLFFWLCIVGAPTFSVWRPQSLTQEGLGPQFWKRLNSQGNNHKLSIRYLIYSQSQKIYQGEMKKLTEGVH